MARAIVGSNPTLSAPGGNHENGSAHSLVFREAMSPYISRAVTKLILLSVVLTVWLCACTSAASPKLVTPTESVATAPVLLPVSLLDDGKREELQLPAATVGQALAQAGRAVYVGDRVDPPLDALVRAGMSIEIVRARAVLIHVDGRELAFRTHQKQVASVLADAGVTLTGRDSTRPPLSAPVEDEIRVVRMAERYRIDYEPVPFDKQWQGVADLEIDQTRMVQAGQNGLLARRVRVPLQDGVVGEGALADEWVQNPPVSRILGYGMSIPIRIIDTPYGPVEYWRAVPMSATSYSPSRAGTPLNAPWFGFTRSGKVLKQGMVATDTRLIPLGTRLYVPGYGLATVEDTGSGVRGRMIDLGYEDHNFRSWRAYLTVYLRTPVPPADQITWILP